MSNTVAKNISKHMRDLPSEFAKGWQVISGIVFAECESTGKTLTITPRPGVAFTGKTSDGEEKRFKSFDKAVAWGLKAA